MWELLKRLFSHPVIATEMLVASFLANLLALASPLFVIQVLNRYVAHGVDATLATLTVGVVAAVLLEFGFRQVRLRLAKTVCIDPDERMAFAGFAVLTNAKRSALDRVPPGMAREVIGGAAAVEQAYSAPNIGAVFDVPFALLFVGVLFLLQPIIAVIAVGFAAFAFISGSIGQAGMRRPTRDLVVASGAGNATLATATQEPDTVRAFNAAGFLAETWQRQTRAIQTLRRRLASRQGFVQSLGQSTAALMNVAIIATGAVLVVKGEFSVGAMIGANIVASRALMPITRLAQMGGAFARARQSLEMMREFAKLPLEARTGSAKSRFKGGLELRDLAFAFPGASGPLFESVNVKLEPGAVLMVTGGNATGKTTLARLLLGLLEPTRGQILIDGLDSRQAVPEWWRRQVIYLPQEPAFLNATIEENLRVNNSDIDSATLNRLIDVVGLRKFVDESPKGFAEPIAENGANLSLGLRRRLALARALATDGTLAVFDEPTEGFDVDGCTAVSGVMNDLVRRGRTIIVISHDPGIVKGAGMVLDLNAKPVPRLTTLPPSAEALAARKSGGAR